jgi:hypothetical protein
MELVSNMIGVTGRNRSGDELGVIDDVLIELHPDLNVGTFAVVAFGATNGRSRRSYAVPVDLLVADAEALCLVLDATVEEIKAAPVFDPDQYTVFHDNDVSLNAVRDYYLLS